MSFQCSICLGYTPDIEGYASIRCGHVFHTTCITQWLQTGKVCPECRVPSSKGAIIRLYLKTSEGSSQGDTSVVESSEQDTCNWIEKCHTKEMKCQEMQRELEQLRATIEEQTADITANKETARNYAKEFAKLKKDVQDSRECQRVIVQERREVAKERDDAKKELKRMRDENQQLMWLKVSLSGSVEEMDAVLSESMNAGESAAVRQNLAACISVLKKELESSSKKYKDLRSAMDAWSARENRLMAEVEKRGQLISALTDEKKDWEEERSRLVKKMSAMKKIIDAKPGLPQTQIKRFIAESPAPLEFFASPPQAFLSENICDNQMESPPPGAKKACLAGNSGTPESALRRSAHTNDVGPLNFGKKAGNLNVPAKAKLVKSIFGGSTPSPSALFPTGDAENATPWAKNNLAKKVAKRKNYFASKFDPDDDDIQMLN